MAYDNLEDVITSAVEDSQLPVEASTEDTPTEETPELETSSETPEAVSEEPAEDADSQLEAKADEPTADDFDKRFGLQQVSPMGRENRIPYSRVKKITEKAVNEVAEIALGRKLNPGERAADVVKAHVAQLPELQTRVKDYESRLEKVGEFEDIMANQPQKFLQLLSRVPAYEGFFAALREFHEAQQGGAQPARQAAQAPADEADDMPQPDDGEGYSMEGLRKLLDWQERRVESRVKKQIEDRYKPIENAWQEEERLRAVVPVVRAKIDEARKWPKFTDNEEEITRVLASDANISLEAAYQKVVYPKLLTDRDKMRQELLAEISNTPRSTSVAVRTASKPVAPAGPRSLEDIINAEVAKLKSR